MKTPSPLNAIENDVFVCSMMSPEVNFAHASRTDWRKDFVWAEFFARGQRHGLDSA
jgi:hypothetical protein